MFPPDKIHHVLDLNRTHIERRELKLCYFHCRRKPLTPNGVDCGGSEIPVICSSNYKKMTSVGCQRQSRKANGKTSQDFLCNKNALNRIEDSCVRKTAL